MVVVGGTGAPTEFHQPLASQLRAGAYEVYVHTITSPNERPPWIAARSEGLGLCAGQATTIGSFSNPRTVEVCDRFAVPGSISHSGNRFSSSSRAMRPWMRAKAAPRQKWMP